MKRLLILITLVSSACYPLRNARIIDGSENEKTVWVCVPEEEEALNKGGLECARIDRVFGLSPEQHNPTAPAVDAGTVSM